MADDDKPEINARHLGIGIALVVLVLAVVAQAWGPGLLVLARDLVLPIARAIR